METLNQLLETEGPRSIVQKAQELRHIRQLIHGILDKELNEHCEVANLDGDKLVIAVDSAAWATRIRYATPNLLMAFQAHPKLRGINHIRCYIVQ